MGTLLLESSKDRARSSRCSAPVGDSQSYKNSKQKRYNGRSERGGELKRRPLLLQSQVQDEEERRQMATKRSVGDSKSQEKDNSKHQQRKNDKQGSLTTNSKNKARSTFATLIARSIQIYHMFEVHLKHSSAVVAMAAAVLVACAIRGDVLLLSMLAYKTYTGNFGEKVRKSNDNETITQGHTKPTPTLPDYLQLPSDYNMDDLLLYITISVTSALVMYHLVCGYLQIYFYTLKRNKPEKWKCQPHRFLTRSNELHEVVVGTTNLAILSVSSGFTTCWVVNGNYNTMYYKFDEYGYVYLIVSVVALFLWFEAAAYYIHAALHFPWIYKNVHKHHHRYHSPTAYSAIAMSPFELYWLYVAYMAPLFLFPINGLVFITEIVYVYYFSLIDHSGIKMGSVFPWQPNTMFHDDHHRYFHCNFGFNSYLFDWLHGTLRRKDRMYGEDVFWGRGKKRNE